MDAQIRQRLRWVQMYQATGDAGLVCRRCGVSRPTLRKWLRRFKEQGEPGLVSQSKRPQRSPARKIGAELKDQIIEMRAQKNVGARRIQIELRLHGGIELSVTAIQRVLRAAAVRPLLRARRPEAAKRYERPVPGDRVQLDTMKIAAGVYQYTAVDDCS